MLPRLTSSSSLAILLVAHRGPALWGPGSIEFTADGAKLAAAGVRTWRDVSHSTGRWMTWAEVKAAESPSAIRGEACKRAYKAVMAHLEAQGRTAGGARVQRRWWEQVRRTGGGERRESAEVREGYERILSARRTPEVRPGCKWEYRVKWGTGEETWEPGWSLLYGRAGRIVQECEAARAKRVTPCSLYGRLTGEKGYVSDVQEQREPCRDKEAGKREWVAQAVPRRMTRQEVAMAMEGRVEEAGVARAMGGLLGVLARHARAVTVGGEAEEENCEEHAAAAGAGREVRWAGGEDWGWCTPVVIRGLVFRHLLEEKVTND